MRAEMVEIFAQQGEQAGQLLLSLSPLLLLKRFFFADPKLFIQKRFEPFCRSPPSSSFRDFFEDTKLFIQKRFEPFVALPPPLPGEVFFEDTKLFIQKSFKPFVALAPLPPGDFFFEDPKLFCRAQYFYLACTKLSLKSFNFFK